ncbi:SGNH/GDSL hydrolase family protein [Stackebrandtia soli]|uniref:SGNH/GDSL hydrolase family protein n=1 Tax=Stackebrandtia soli TaxID=1892856 RepID=UPI0039EC8359
MTSRLARTLRGAATLLAVTAVALTTSSAPAAASGEVYVALGDSAASGPLIPTQTHIGCARSNHNYAGYTADALGVAEFRDVTCSGADTGDMYQPQSTRTGDVAPQLDALTADTTLVTLHIGANDIDLLDLATDCLNLLPDPFGDPCADDYGDNGTDTWRTATDQLRPGIEQLITDVRARAPQARVFLVGYATYLPDGGCYPRVPVYGDDADYIRGTLTYFNDMLRAAATAQQAGYVDLQTPSEGHDACASSSQRWVEPYIPGSVATPFHPNRNGMENFAQAVLTTIA